VAEVNDTNCFNSSEIGFNNVYTTVLQAAANSTSGAESFGSSSISTWTTILPLVVSFAWAML
jgi:hypothetical protein